MMNQVYLGGIYDEKNAVKKSSAHLTISESKILAQRINVDSVVDGIELAYTIDFSDLKVSRGGVGNRFYFLETKSNSDVSFYTEDKNLLKTLQNMGCEAVFEFATESKNESFKNAKWVAMITLVVALFGYGLYSLKDPVVGLAVKAIPVSWEENLSELSMKQMQLSQSFVKDSAAIRELVAMTQPLLKNLDSKKYTYRFYISHSDELNAFAMPGGYVVVNEGLLRASRNAEEVLGVLGHELGHVERQHGMQQMVSSLGIMALAQIFLGDASGLLAAATQGGAMLMTKSFSRDHERDADKFGVQLLQKSQINPQGLVSFFEILQRKEKDNQVIETMNKTLSFMSTHPATEERIQDLKAMIAQNPKVGSNTNANNHLVGLKKILKM